MEIEGIIWLESVVEKIVVKHHVMPHEVEEAFEDDPKFRFRTSGVRLGEDVYLMLGRTLAGRYLSVFWILKHSKSALILSAREMVRRERKRYEEK